MNCLTKLLSWNIRLLVTDMNMENFTQVLFNILIYDEYYKGQFIRNVET